MNNRPHRRFLCKKIFFDFIQYSPQQSLNILKKRGIDIFRDYRYYPNQLVFNKIYEALQK